LNHRLRAAALQAFLPWPSLAVLILLRASPAFAVEVPSQPNHAVSEIRTPADTLTRYPRAVSNVRVQDTPNDAGRSVDITWDRSPDDSTGGKVKRYLIRRATISNGASGAFSQVGETPAGAASFSDAQTDDDSTYVYSVSAANDSTVNGRLVWKAETASVTSAPVRSSAQWFDFQRINVFVGVIILSALIMYYIKRAKSGKSLFIRKIAGLEAVDEAVGRATEMGRKIFYIPGSQDMDQVQTLAGITILGRVAEMAAQYEAGLDVPVSRSLVMVTCREVVKEAYAKAGRPDSFQENQVRYLTDDQFGYAAAIDGMVVREKPATIFLMGMFFAESLILAETGNSVGAIQIAGTGEPSQLPFFIAACDYTLIGEELFVASAYLSREPRQLGSLKGQDIGKGLILLAIIIGIILESFQIAHVSKLFKVIGQ